MQVDDRFVTLVDGYAEGELNTTELTELSERLRGDEEAQAFFRSMLGAQGLLRWRYAFPHLVEQVMSRLRTAQTEATKRDVMRVAQASDRDWLRYVRHRRPGWLGVSAIAASIVFASGLFVSDSTRRSDLVTTGYSRPRGRIAELAQCRGMVFRIDRTSRVTMSEGDPVHAGDMIRAVGGNTTATIRYPDSTVLKLGVDTLLGFEISGGPQRPYHPALQELEDRPGKDVFIARGQVLADVSAQKTPMAFRTPHAEAIVLGTQVKLTVEETITRVDVGSGHVLLTRLSDGAHVELGGGSFSIVGPDVSLEPKPLVVMDIVGTRVPGLIGHWRFDETAGSVAFDSSGNGHHAQIHGAEWVSGKVGPGALRFDGTGQYVEDPDGADYINGLTAFTLAVWVKSDALRTDRGIVVGKDPDLGDEEFGLLRYDAYGTHNGINAIKAGINTHLGGWLYYESRSGTQTRDWQHLVLTWRSGEPLVLYINGVRDEPTYSSPGWDGGITGATKLIIGKGCKDVAGTSWLGIIDDVRLYNYSLPTPHIEALARGEEFQTAARIDSGEQSRSQ